MIRWLLLGLLIFMVYRMIRGMIFISTVHNQAQKQARNRAQRQARNQSGQQRSTSVKDRLQSIEEADFEEVEPEQTQDKT